MRVIRLLLPLISFGAGSLMFSLWLARLRGRDLRSVGDGNPGAVNAIKVAGPVIGGLALLLDFLKGAVPVAIGYWGLKLTGVLLGLTIIAPVLGHAFSPWLRFKGGKAIAVTFGVWSGVTLWEVPCILGGVLILTRFILRLRDDRLCVLISLLVMVLYISFRFQDPVLIGAALANVLTVMFKHLMVLRR